MGIRSLDDLVFGLVWFESYIRLLFLLRRAQCKSLCHYAELSILFFFVEGVEVWCLSC